MPRMKRNAKYIRSLECKYPEKTEKLRGKKAWGTVISPFAQQRLRKKTVSWR